MPKYENSIIYKLCHCNDLENENIYIGSTTNFRIRKNKHKNSCYNENSKDFNYPVYEYIRNNGGWNEWKMIPIEVFPCKDKKELEVRENYHIELLKSKLNKQIPTRNIKEWYKDNKKILAEKQKEKYEANKEIILGKQKEYYEANKQAHSERMKKHYKANKEKILEKTKDYYENNKEIINQKNKEKIKCDHCGCEITKINLKRHQKTKKCIESV